MTEQITKACVKLLSANGVIPEDQKNVIQYGTELIIASVIGIFLILIVSWFMGVPTAWLFYLAGFVPLRITAGGYHASTHLRCYTFFTVVFGGCMVLENSVSGTLQPLVISLVSIVLMFVLSPVEAANKPLRDEQRKRNRRSSLCIMCIEIILSVLVWLLDADHMLIHIFYWGVFAAASSLVIAKIGLLKRKEERA